MSRSELASIGFAEYKRAREGGMPLSETDEQIFDLSCRGASIVEISMRTHCSTATVSRRRAAILSRLRK